MVRNLQEWKLERASPTLPESEPRVNSKMIDRENHLPLRMSLLLNFISVDSLADLIKSLYIFVPKMIKYFFKILLL